MAGMASDPNIKRFVSSNFQPENFLDEMRPGPSTEPLRGQFASALHTAMLGILEVVHGVWKECEDAGSQQEK